MINAAAFASMTGTGLDQAEARLGRYERTLLSMRPWLPEKCEAFLDVGCGLGGVAILVARRYPGAEIHLLDGDLAGEKWGGFREDGRPWADVNVAARICARELPGRSIVPWTPVLVRRWGHRLGAEGGFRFDLVYSICSWGHHYPIETYVDEVRGGLRSGGRLIVDLRREHAERGRAELHQDFDWLADIARDGKKYVRTVWERP